MLEWYLPTKKSLKPIFVVIDDQKAKLRRKVSPVPQTQSVRKHISPCMDVAFKYAKAITEEDLKSKDMNYLYDLCYSLKVGTYLWNIFQFLSLFIILNRV